MKFKRYLLYIALLLPFMASTQSQVVKNLQKDHPKGSYQFFYESIIRAAANVAMGKEGVEFTKGIHKAISVDIEKLDNAKELYVNIQQELKANNYETYIKITNNGSMAKMLGFLMDQMATIEIKEGVTGIEIDQSVAKEMTVFAIDNGQTISALSILILGNDTLKLYEVYGKLQLDSLPEIINRIQGLMDMFGEQ